MGALRPLASWSPRSRQGSGAGGGLSWGRGGGARRGSPPQASQWRLFPAESAGRLLERRSAPAGRASVPAGPQHVVAMGVTPPFRTPRQSWGYFRPFPPAFLSRLPPAFAWSDLRGPRGLRCVSQPGPGVFALGWTFRRSCGTAHTRRCPVRWLTCSQCVSGWAGAACLGFGKDRGPPGRAARVWGMPTVPGPWGGGLDRKSVV